MSLTQWWRAIFRQSPAFNPTTPDQLRAVRGTAAAQAYQDCAKRMERWADLTAARGGKPDWSEFHTILANWRNSARHLRGPQ
jgi:hypothetical protein